MSKKSQKMWSDVRSKIEAGNFPPIFITGNGALALDGSAAMLPQAIADLYPADILAAAKAKREAFDADQAAKASDAAAQRQAAEDRKQAVIATYGQKRCWRLNGLYVEEFTDRYTYAEIWQWIDCEAYVLRHDHPRVSIVCDRGDDGEFFIDVSGYFDDVVNTANKTPTFGYMARKLQAFVMDRRANAAENN